ncbi:MAG TPA: hypothetical protein PK916_08745 [Bacteroidota bacterium]|nr:hypothetical protein [Bacteroidota bacterium]
MNILDKQIYQFRDRMVADVGVEERYLAVICTTIYQELSVLKAEQLDKIEFASPVKLDLRIEELEAFNMMMSRVNRQLASIPEIVRAQVIVQNYIAFVYLKDNCFDVAKRIVPQDSLLRRLCKFLLNNPVRAFRNSIAHGNWQYTSDFTGIKYYAYKGESKPCVELEEMSEFVVKNDELEFWQALSRATAYTIYTCIVENREMRQ